MVTLDRAELKRRAARIRLVVTDCDGVLTDGRVYYSARGEELLCFSRRDGMGMELLARQGIRTAILTREQSDIVAARARKLRLEFLFAGVQDKRAFLPELLARTGVAEDEVAYVGDDVNDVELLRAIAETGLTGAPQDGVTEAKALAHVVTKAGGGFGAFRDFADFIVDLRQW